MDWLQLVILLMPVVELGDKPARSLAKRTDILYLAYFVKIC